MTKRNALLMLLCMSITNIIYTMEFPSSLSPKCNNASSTSSEDDYQWMYEEDYKATCGKLVEENKKLKKNIRESNKKLK